MVQITIDISEEEITQIVKEAWHQKVRLKVGHMVQLSADEIAIDTLTNLSKAEVKEMFQEALEKALSKFAVRDMQQVHALLNLPEYKKRGR